MDITQADVTPLLTADAGTELTWPRTYNVIDTAVEHVNRYAPGAPRAAKCEAAARFASYMLDGARNPLIMRSVAKTAFEASGFDTSSVDYQYVTNHSAMFRNCGAAALLSPWKVRRAGRVD